jgi:hypothetical protein
MYVDFYISTVCMDIDNSGVTWDLDKYADITVS